MFLKLSHYKPYDTRYLIEFYIPYVYQRRWKEQDFLFASVKMNVHGD